MAQTIVAGNWKMNLTPAEGVTLIEQVVSQLTAETENVKILFCVPYTHLHAAQEVIARSAKTKNIFLGAQNCYHQANGAYTGEISIAMLKEFGVSHVLVGHSERRQFFTESNELLKHKVDALLQNALTPVFCCGEPLEVREAGNQNTFAENQLIESILHLSETEIQKVVIAYEPIWAIGTGVTASAAQAQAMHAHLRAVLAKQYGIQVANNISVLYGGSCNPGNAEELFTLDDVDGGLIGGAALKADQFIAIINAGK
jgi:triosephosphate isomerase (TIM)